MCTAANLLDQSSTNEGTELKYKKFEEILFDKQNLVFAPDTGP